MGRPIKGAEPVTPQSAAPAKSDDRLVHVTLTATPNAEEEAVFAEMLRKFLARAAHEREVLKQRSEEVFMPSCINPSGYRPPPFLLVPAWAQ